MKKEQSSSSVVAPSGNGEVALDTSKKSQNNELIFYSTSCYECSHFVLNACSLNESCKHKTMSRFKKRTNQSSYHERFLEQTNLLKDLQWLCEELDKREHFEDFINFLNTKGVNAEQFKMMWLFFGKNFGHVNVQSQHTLNLLKQVLELCCTFTKGLTCE